MNKKELIFLVFALLISFSMMMVSAEKQAQEAVKQSQCFTVWNTCSNCTTMSVPNILDPFNNIAASPFVVSTADNIYWNGTFCNGTILGVYTVNWCGDPNGESWCKPVDLPVTPQGQVTNTSGALLYILLIVAIFILFAASFYFCVTMPYGNERGERGVTKIVKLKYIKLLLIIVTYQLGLWFLNVLIGVADNYLNIRIYYGFVSFLFLVLSKMSYLVAIVIFVIGFINLVKDINIKQQLDDMGRTFQEGM